MKLSLGVGPSIKDYQLLYYIKPEFERKKYEAHIVRLSEEELSNAHKTIKEKELDGIILSPDRQLWKEQKEFIVAAILRKLDHSVYLRKGNSSEFVTNNGFLARQWNQLNNETMHTLEMDDEEFARHLADQKDINALFLGAYLEVYKKHNIVGEKLKDWLIPFASNQLIITTNTTNTAAPVLKKLEVKNSRILFESEQTFTSSILTNNPELVACEASFRTQKLILNASVFNKDATQRLDISSEDDIEDFGTDAIKELANQFIQKGANALLHTADPNYEPPRKRKK